MSGKRSVKSSSLNLKNMVTSGKRKGPVDDYLILLRVEGAMLKDKIS